MAQSRDDYRRRDRSLHGGIEPPRHRANGTRRSTLKQFCNFIYLKGRPNHLPVFFISINALAPVHYFSDVGDFNAGITHICHKFFTTSFTATYQEAAGANQPQRIDIQQTTYFSCFGKNRNFVLLDLNLVAAGNAHFFESCCQPPFSYIVHSTGSRCCGGNFRFSDNTDVI